MPGKLALVAAAALALAACSSTPPPEAPLVDAEPEPSTADAPADHAAAPDLAPEPAPAPAPAAKRSGADSIPDDYSITNGDCAALGKQLANVWRADEVAKLSPKLNEKQRAQAEKSLDDGASKAGEKWTEGCLGSLVGKTADPKSLKCALDSRSVKAFDTCINGEAPPKAKP